MPTVDEVEDYDFRLRVEAEERGDEVEDNDDDNCDDANDNNGDAPKPNLAVQGRCKICFDGETCMASCWTINDVLYVDLTFPAL